MDKNRQTAAQGNLTDILSKPLQVISYYFNQDAQG